MLKFTKKIGLLICSCLLLSGALVGCSGESAPLPVPATDYSVKENWFTMKADSKNDVDTFYFYPTCWAPVNGDDSLYCDLDNKIMRNRVPQVYEQQAKILEEDTNMFVPWYRQADATKILEKSETERTEMIAAMPYVDCEAAFDYYIKHYNNNRPFILAGHSQGSMIIKMLLERYMPTHKDVLDRMIVSYALGYSFEGSYFDKNTHLKLSTVPNDLNKVVTWNLERQVDNKFSVRNGCALNGAKSLNPITFTHDETLIPSNDPRQLGSPLHTLKYDVQVKYDIVKGCETTIIGIDNDSLDSTLIGDLSLHSSDWGLFLNNIKANAKLRVNTYLQK